MDKIIPKFFVFAVLFFFLSGCNWVQKMSSSNSNAEDKTRETLGLKKTEIPECDEVIEILARKAKGNATAQEEESWTDRAATELVKQQIYKYLNDGNANKSQKEKAELAGKCKTALGYLKDEPKNNF